MVQSYSFLKIFLYLSCLFPTICMYHGVTLDNIRNIGVFPYTGNVHGYLPSGYSTYISSDFYQLFYSRRYFQAVNMKKEIFLLVLYVCSSSFAGRLFSLIKLSVCHIFCSIFMIIATITNVTKKSVTTLPTSTRGFEEISA
jgi:hypothetical protein